MTTENTATDTLVGTLPPSTDVVAASLATGRAQLTQVDDFVRHQSQFDRQARVNLQQRTLTVTPEIYLDYLRSQVMPWSGEELAALKQIIAAIAAKFAPLDIALPDTIYLVKTSGQEEGYAAYTRQRDVIALPANMVASLQTAPNYGDPLHPAQSLTYLQDTITHECFHLFSKNNAERRWRLYAAIHYQPTGAAVELPDIPWPDSRSPGTMRDLKITNPDTPVLDVYIEMAVKEDPDAADAPLVRRSLLPVLLASGPYQGGIFFDYLQWYFLAIERDAAGRWRPVMTAADRPVVYPMSPANPQLWDQYLQLIGNNVAGELFHPDEVLAQNFVFVANLPTLGLLTTMGDLLRQA